MVGILLNREQDRVMNKNLEQYTKGNISCVTAIGKKKLSHMEGLREDTSLAWKIR